MLLYIMLAYSMLFTALFNVACLHNAYSFFADDVCKRFLSSGFVFVLLTQFFASNIILHHVQCF